MALAIIARVLDLLESTAAAVTSPPPVAPARGPPALPPGAARERRAGQGPRARAGRGRGRARGGRPPAWGRGRASDLREDVAALQRTLTKIRAAVNAAEERQANDASVKLWLSEVRALAYDAEDVFEEFSSELVSGPLSDLLDQVRHSSLIPALWAPPTEPIMSMAQRMKELRVRLVELDGKSEALRLIEACGVGYDDARRWRPSGGLMDDESPVFGRKEDREEILKLLLDEELSAAKLSVLPIVGMGGLGKTTLAQLIYNDGQIENFDVRMWIHVSQDFDAIKLTKEMVESLTGKPCLFSDLHSLQAELGRMINGKCFFLVLDDVWDENKSHWESLKMPLSSAHEGSKIILTTRSHGVAQSMGTMPSYNLQSLKDDDCWSLFSEKAFHGRTPDERLVKIGQKIVKKCCGLPLTLKMLGLHFQSEEREDKWSEILDSNIWDLSGYQNSILPILMLSYLQLPAPVKQCFTYCSIFGKGHQFLRHKIVRMWMAQGYVENEGERNTEDIGHDYFDILLSRSFFQSCSGGIYFVMHDLIHDLAESISGNECFKTDVLPDEQCNGMVVNRMYNLPKGVRHSSLTIFSTAAAADLHPLLAATSLRTLFLNYTSWSWLGSSVHHPNTNALNDLFMKLKYLRVLVLDYTVPPTLPDSLSNLKCLRYLGILGKNWERFPESICSLKNLQTIQWESNIVLPQGISNLVNLRHLDGQYSVPFPKGIGRLKKLQELSGFCVSRLSSAGIEELKDLENLRGKLKLLNLEYVADVEDAKKANLKGKQYLTSLDLEWNSDAGYRNNAAQLIQHLQPHTNIQEVGIRGYQHDHLPEWVCHPSYSKLVTIRLQKCVLLTLPEFGQLLFLQHLALRNIEGLKYIGPAFFHRGFPSLKTLQLFRISQMVEWSGAQQGELPHLNELSVDRCDSLKCLPLDNLTSLKILRISYCSNLHTVYSESTMRFVGVQHHKHLEQLSIIGCPQIKFLPEYQVPASLQFLEVTGSPSLMNWCHRVYGSLIHVQKLRGVDSREVKLNDILTVQEAKIACLNIPRIYMLHLVWETSSLVSIGGTHEQADEVLKCLQPNVILNKLVIRGYNGVSFAGWISSPSYSNLVSIRLISCPNCKVLPALGQLPHLMILHLESLHGIKSIDLAFYGNGTEKGFQSLRRLELLSMSALEVWEGASDGEFPTLRQLYVRDCTKLRGLPCLPPSVQEIKVENCPEMVLDLPSSLGSLLDLHVSNISVMKELRQLSYLSALVVENCMGHALAELPSLRKLVVNGCNERMMIDSLPSLTLLTGLNISRMADLESLQLQNFRILEELVVSDCPKLVSIECSETLSYEPYYIEGLESLPSLKHMTLRHCPILQLSASEKLPSTIQSFTISGCHSLKTWYERYSTRFSTSGIHFHE